MALSDDLKNKIKRAQAGFDRKGKYLTLEANKSTVLRVLDGAWGTDQLFYYQFGIHYLGDESVVCRRVTADSTCLICEESDRLKEEISEKKQVLDQLKNSDLSREEGRALEEEISVLEAQEDALYVSKKWKMNVLVKGEQHPRIYTAPWSIFNSIWGVYVKNAEDGDDILDPVCGCSFECKRTGSGRYDTKYEAEVLIKPKPLMANEDGSANHAEIDRVLSERWDLTEDVEIPSSEEVADAYEKYQNGLASGKIKLDLGDEKQDTKAESKTDTLQETRPEPAPVATGTQSAAARLSARLKDRKF